TQPQNLYAALEKDNRLDLFQTGVNVQNDLSFSGGDENTTYFFSLQDVSIKGILPGDKSRRTGGRFNGSRKFGKLNTSYNINYVKFNKDMSPDGPWLSTYTSPANIDFSQMRDWQDPTSPANPLYYFTDQIKNPFFLLDNNRDKTGQNTFNGKIELDYEFTPWFSALYRLGMYNVSEETRSTTGKFQRSEEHTSELQSRENLVCLLLLEKKYRAR